MTENGVPPQAPVAGRARSGPYALVVAGHNFRAGIVAVVRRGDGRIMAFERVDSPGQWQLPQGGLERGETPEQAAWRELGEETGLDGRPTSSSSASTTTGS